MAVLNSYVCGYACTELDTLIGQSAGSIKLQHTTLTNTSLAKIGTINVPNVTDISTMCSGFTKLTALPTLIAPNVTDVSSAFLNCYNVDTGILAMYNYLSSLGTVTTTSSCFTYCGRDTTSGAAELAQIPSTWK